MEISSMESNPISVPNLCEWCGGAGTCRCGRCHVVYYCSREHQMEHWAIHKKVCKKSAPPVVASAPMINNIPLTSSMSLNMPSASTISFNMPSASTMNLNMSSASSIGHNMPSSANMNLLNMPGTSSLTFSPTATWNQSNIPTHIDEGISRFPAYGNMFDPNNPCIPPEKPIDFNTASVEDILSSITNDFLSSDNSFWNLIDTCNAQDVSDLEMYLGKDGMNQISASQNHSAASNISNADSANLTNDDDDKNLVERQPLSEICEDIITDLNDYGICILDNFLGSKRGNLILDEVKSMYTSGLFEKGKLVKSSAYIPSEIIRSDVMTWVNGSEPYCQNIKYLIQKLDLVIATCNKMPNNGQLSNYKLHRRTKAMVACYPGNRTHYKRHVDNPNKDGRCITCIYYLNKNWDSMIHGGLLRMFPSVKGDVIEIEPIFDRMIFFWSDKRNPHEVLPAFATRFAITVWYFDADEREESLRKQQEIGENP